MSRVELLTADNDVSQFDCGKHVSLTDWLKRFARMNQASGDTRTYVVHRNSSVVGYYSLTPGSVSRREATARAGKAAPEPIPIVLLARLAVDIGEQGKGLGSALLKDALQRAYAGAEIIGGRAVLVHAIDAEAGAFYRKYGFESCPGLELHLMLLMKDLRATLGL
ncbi:MAG: GNAT family N-acetyltransferase [Terriglobales bacterium]